MKSIVAVKGLRYESNLSLLRINAFSEQLTRSREDTSYMLVLLKLSVMIERSVEYG